eukprot:922249-Lingulodinium_polyedra.AAC.1
MLAYRWIAPKLKAAVAALRSMRLKGSTAKNARSSTPWRASARNGRSSACNRATVPSGPPRLASVAT